MNNPQHTNDELSLIDLMHIFWQQRVLILGVTLVSFLISLGYVYHATPIYEATAYLEAPTKLDLSSLNAASLHNPKESILNKYNVAAIYNLFTKTLLSNTTKEQYFNEIYWPYQSQETDLIARQRAYDAYIKNLKIKQDLLEKTDYKLSFQSISKERAEQFLNQYMQLAQEQLVTNLNAQFNYQIQEKINFINAEIKILKQRSKKSISDELAKLQEAMQEAQANNTERFLESSMRNSQPQLFMLGTKVLTSRINNLKQKTIFPPFLNKYRKLQSDYSFYSKIAQTPFQIHFESLIPTVKASEFPISPKKNLIILLGLIIGSIVGLILALVIFLIRQNYKAPEVNSHTAEVLC